MWLICPKYKLLFCRICCSAPIDLFSVRFWRDCFSLQFLVCLFCLIRSRKLIITLSVLWNPVLFCSGGIHPTPKWLHTGSSIRIDRTHRRSRRVDRRLLAYSNSSEPRFVSHHSFSYRSRGTVNDQLACTNLHGYQTVGLPCVSCLHILVKGYSNLNQMGRKWSSFPEDFRFFDENSKKT